ncbi:hypothetical protein QA645_41075 [Bradyrhizobium sp. CIAT3101]|uniref:hypothetical protein n=1 Tax=Bradyrhizobium sp. CIAT3101 TaxID=439387 RepID=UPI0024B0C14C|nr:hypothetical protein [Bradyrhizobium sp. CIAT3101]WFU80743.1 hypothetical protein QA645_41075 [Bradyrhizobium sp. CIAT3101]
MTSSVEADRGSQLLLAVLPDMDLQGVRLALDRAALEIVIDDNVEQIAWAQACAIAIVACGRKMFRRGIFLSRQPECETVVGNGLPRLFKRALLEAGCRKEPAPAHSFRICIGGKGAAHLYASANGWNAIVGPNPAAATSPGNELSGIFAGAASTAAAFRASVLSDPVATRRTLEYNLWQPQGQSSPASAELRNLPADLWLLGMGNLGQATLFTLGLLPYRDTSQVRLLLNDPDISGWENLGVQLLTQPSWIGRTKVRCAADWAERVGFRTVLNERKFLMTSGPDQDEPRVALAGVDNLNARRFAASAGFDLLIDAGLGSTANEAFDVRLHAFPGSRTPFDAWPEADSSERDGEGNVVKRGNIQSLVQAGVLDECGAITIENQPVGVPCTALAAAAVQVAQLCRAIETGTCCEMVDFDLVNSKRAVSQIMDRPVSPIVACPAR